MSYVSSSTRPRRPHLLASWFSDALAGLGPLPLSARDDGGHPASSPRPDSADAAGANAGSGTR